MQIDIRYQPSYSLAIVRLEPEERVQAEAGAMVSMNANMAIDTGLKGGLLGAVTRSVLGGETLFANTFTAKGGPGEITLAPALPGDIAALRIDKETIYIQSGSFLASAPEIDLDLKWGGARTFFGSEGLFLLRATGSGPVLLCSYGAIHKVSFAVHLRHGPRRRLHAGAGLRRPPGGRLEVDAAVGRGVGVRVPRHGGPVSADPLDAGLPVLAHPAHPRAHGGRGRDGARGPGEHPERGLGAPAGRRRTTRGGGAMLKLYRVDRSTNVERVELALGHKRLRAERITVPFDDRHEIRRVSGQDLVPLLEHDGRVVVDSMEIVRYLEETFPDTPRLYPADPARRADCLLFIDWFNRVWKRPPNEMEGELSRPETERDPACVARLGAALQGYLGLFEQMLTGREYLLGDFSAADVCAFPFLKYAARLPADDPHLFHRILHDHQRPGDAHPRLLGWIRRMDRRPREAAG